MRVHLQGHEILTGVVSRVDTRTGASPSKISSTRVHRAILPPTRASAREVLTEGTDQGLCGECASDPRPPGADLPHPSRSVKRLFELEARNLRRTVETAPSRGRPPAAQEGRALRGPEVDPIGACVGPRGGRVAPM
jgi:N utilization substance protein A